MFHPEGTEIKTIPSGLPQRTLPDDSVVADVVVDNGLTVVDDVRVVVIEDVKVVVDVVD
jgi:hypothetical protein